MGGFFLDLGSVGLKTSTPTERLRHKATMQVQCAMRQRDPKRV